MERPARILPVIVISQFTGTALWFAGNAVIPDLQAAWDLTASNTGHITSAVQLGFISGTLVFAFLAFADRFSARRVFFFCSVAGALANGLILFSPQTLSWLLVSRFLTGFFLAGIYPVGMKIAASWYERGLGRALGYLVGALVLGTAFPHLVRAAGADLPWQQVMVVISMLAASGGALMLVAVPDGPYLASASPFNPRALAIIFRSREFRASAFGYFGHMWELYALWAFIPAWLIAYNQHSGSGLNVPLWSFIIIAIGFFGCAMGGIISERIGSLRVAAIQLLVSGICCVLSVFFLDAGKALFIAFMLFWGITVIGDSPQFSALNAHNAPREYVGSALTIANCLGFLITVFSIQLVEMVLTRIGPEFMFWWLIPGPILGLLALRPLFKAERE